MKNQKIKSSRNLLFSFSICLTVLLSCSKNPKIPVWEISKENSPTSYLVGTINYLKKETTSDILDQSVLSYLRNSESFICQIDIKKSDYFITKSHLEIKKEKILKDILSEKDLKQLKKLQAQWNLTHKNQVKPPDSCRMKLLFYLEEILYSNNSLYFNFDSFWRRHAMTKNIDVFGLETYQDYYKSLSEISTKEQINFMYSIKNSSGFMSQLSNNIDSLYKIQNNQEIHQIITTKFNYLSTNYTSLFTQKHKVWVSKLNDFLASKKCFISMDISHLYGENNLIENLLQKGYKIKKIQ